VTEHFKEYDMDKQEESLQKAKEDEARKKSPGAGNDDAAELSDDALEGAAGGNRLKPPPAYIT
jgi:hypothetical protein